MRRSIRRGMAGAVLAIVTAAAGRARGDEPSAIAEALFRSGRELMAAEKYAEACPKFAESERVDPKPGTLMNLALCHEKTGKTASAWAEYLEAAETARRAGESAREHVARDRATALEPTLSHVVIDADPASTAQVSLDDRVLGPGAFGTPIPIDPGDHVLHATGPGKRPFSQQFSVAAGATSSRLRVPALDAEAPPPAATVRVDVQPAPVDAPGAPGGKAAFERAVAGLVAGGAGVALVGIGAFFGVRAFADKRTADSDCGATLCTAPGLAAIQSMRTAEAVSTLSMATGVAAIGGGVLLVLWGRSRGTRPASAWRIEPDIATHGARVLVDW